ncbi:GGDEF domain-containing protein [Lacrimispora sp. JR3]|uniref:GGDEF domain-containing protein n=1 Tax=Lacrimispora sinapis TaxID=3111456 RepID=UPI0037484471
MKKENLETASLTEMEKGDKRIDRDWLLLHYKTTIGVVVFAVIVECLLSLLFVGSDLVTIPTERYIFKYIAVPSSLNFICIGVETWALRSKYLSQEQKIYTVSLVFVFICFVLFCVHSRLTAIYYIFTGAIMLTTIYADYWLTSITAAMSIISIAVSEIFIRWNPMKPYVFDSMLEFGDFLVSILVLFAFSAACMVVIRFEKKKNEASYQKEIERYELKQSINRDELTGIYNRKAMHEALGALEEQDSFETCILATADIDYFKGINDSWGHSAGDWCLKEFARILTENERHYTPFRYGGDEFCLLFENVTMEEAVSICDRIRRQVEELSLKDHPQIKLTASFGLAAYAPYIDATRLFIHSDHALYDAKKLRNSICIYEKDRLEKSQWMK